MTPVFQFFRSQKGIAISLVILTVIFNAVFLWSEVSVSTFNLNDEVLHLTVTQQTSFAIHQNLNPTDYWLTQIGLGFPLFHYYQHLPQVLLAGLDQVTSSVLPLPRLVDLSRYLLLVLFPITMYVAMRRFGFDYLAASLSAVFVSFISANHLYGIECMSYIWNGVGLYTQLWAMFFLPLALAEIYRTMKGQGSWFLPILLSTIVLLSNLIYGYILIISVILFIFLTPNIQEILSRAKRTAVIFILTAITTAYFFIPFLLDNQYLNRSVLEVPAKYSSYGIALIVNWLVSGTLFDYNRLPVLTILFFIGLIFVITQWRNEKYRLLVILFIFWLLVYFGPATWGNTIYTILPFSYDIQFHRFIGIVQIAAVMIAGAGLSLLIGKIKIKTDPTIAIVVGLLILLVLTPVFLERAQYYDINTQRKLNTQSAILSDQTEIADIKNTLTNLPPGRVYTGLPPDFGMDYRFSVGGVPMYSILPQLGLDSFGYAYTAFPLSTDPRLYFNNTRIEQYNLFNIRYVLLAKSWTPAYYYTKIKSFDHFDLYEVPTTGYFDIVDVPAVFYGDKSAFFTPNVEWLASDLPSQKLYPMIILENFSRATAQGLPIYSFQNVTPDVLNSLSLKQSAGGKVDNESVLPNEYRAGITVTHNSYLLLKTNYHPGWEVTVDQKKVVPVMLAPGFIGIPVTPGSHQAVFTYHSPSYRLPLLGASIILLVILFLIERPRFRAIFSSGVLRK